MMDFSASQDGAWRDEFVACFLEMDNTLEEAELRAEVTKHLGGCDYHYDTSSNRVASNGSIIPRAKKVQFKADALKLRQITAKANFDRHVTYMRREYPLANSWLDWWLHPHVSTKIFAACKTMSDALWSALPRTNNAEESMHKRLYVATSKGLDFLQGMTRLVAWLQSFEKMDKAHEGKSCVRSSVQLLIISAGLGVRYGQPARRIGPRTRSKKAKPTPGVKFKLPNDGRAPDTTDTLLPRTRKRKWPQVIPDSPSESDSASGSDSPPPKTPSKRPKVTAPKVSLRSKRKAKDSSDIEGAVASKRPRVSPPPEHTPTSVPHPLTALTHAQVREDMGAEFQGIPWAANSCWLDASIMPLLAIIYQDRRTFTDMFYSVPEEHGLHHLLSFISPLFCAIFAPQPSPSLPATLMALRVRFREYLEATNTDKLRFEHPVCRDFRNSYASSSVRLQT